MKKILSILLLIFILPAFIVAFSINNINVLAFEEKFGRILKNDVMIYASPTLESELFLLPVTYYVTIIGEENGFYEVEYQSNKDGYLNITGFVLKDMVEKPAKTPTTPLYPSSTLKIIIDTVIYSEPSSSSELKGGILKNQQVKYYGKISNQETHEVYYYIKSGKRFGYVLATSLTAPNITPHPDPLPVPDPLPLPDPPPETNDSKPNISNIDNKMQIILILTIAIPSIFIVYFLFKPTKKKTSPSRQKNNEIYYKEDDDDDE